MSKGSIESRNNANTGPTNDPVEAFKTSDKNQGPISQDMVANAVNAANSGKAETKLPDNVQKTLDAALKQPEKAAPQPMQSLSVGPATDMKATPQVAKEVATPTQTPSTAAQTKTATPKLGEMPKEFSAKAADVNAVTFGGKAETKQPENIQKPLNTVAKQPENASVKTENAAIQKETAPKEFMAKAKDGKAVTFDTNNPNVSTKSFNPQNAPKSPNTPDTTAPVKNSGATPATPDSVGNQPKANAAPAQNPDGQGQAQGKSAANFDPKKVAAGAALIAVGVVALAIPVVGPFIAAAAIVGGAAMLAKGTGVMDVLLDKLMGNSSGKGPSQNTGPDIQQKGHGKNMSTGALEAFDNALGKPLAGNNIGEKMENFKRAGFEKEFDNKFLKGLEPKAKEGFLKDVMADARQTLGLGEGERMNFGNDKHQSAMRDSAGKVGADRGIQKMVDYKEHREEKATDKETQANQKNASKAARTEKVQEIKESIKSAFTPGDKAEKDAGKNQSPTTPGNTSSLGQAAKTGVNGIKQLNATGNVMGLSKDTAALVMGLANGLKMNNFKQDGVGTPSTGKNEPNIKDIANTLKGIGASAKDTGPSTVAINADMAQLTAAKSMGG